MLSARIELERSADFSVSAALDIPSGVTALFGPSGSGKSTILQVLSGLERGRAQDVIEVSLGGEVWQDPSTFVLPERRRVGYVFQQPQLFPHLSVEANLRYGEKRAADRLITYTDVDSWLDLAPLMSRPTTKLSGGESQRVAIGRALMASPRVLLMDEPLGSIDESARMRILPYLARLRAVLDIPIVYVTHSMQEVSYLADNVYRIEAGRIVAEGSVFETSAAIESEEPAAVLELAAAEYDPAYQLARFRLGDAPLYVATQPIEPETRVRIRIPARDVSITRQRPTETSILNVIPTRIDQLEPHPTQASVVARLTAGEHTLLASITKRSFDGLALEVGQHVFAQVKGVALLTDHGR